MSVNKEAPTRSRILWIAGSDLSIELDAATWLETTRVLMNLGWDVTLISEGADGWQLINDMRVYCISRPSFYFIGSMLLHLRLLRYVIQNRENTDILLFHQMAANWLFLLQLISRLIGWKMPVVVMDTRDIPRYGSGLKYWLRETYFKLTHVIANSLAMGQTAITQNMAEFIKIPQKKLLGTWPSGVHIEQFKPARFGRKWPQSDEPVHLIYIGSLLFDRKLLPLCRAVMRANENVKSFKLTLLGNGPERDVLKEFANHSKGSVIVRDPVPYDEVPSFLELAHIGVTSLPASDDRKFETSSPIKLFEYMAAGLPLLTTRNSSHTSVVKQGNYAFWADDGNEKAMVEVLKQIWQGRRHLSDMGAKAAMASTDWSWQASGRKLSGALRTCLLKKT